jgi:hypothetical protein
MADAAHDVLYKSKKRTCLPVLEFNMQINLYLSASIYKSMYACLCSIHCFYVYCAYEKRSI